MDGKVVDTACEVGDVVWDDAGTRDGLLYHVVRRLAVLPPGHDLGGDLGARVEV